MVQHNRPFFPALRKVYVATSRRATDAEEREKRKQWGELVLPPRATPEKTQSALLWEPRVIPTTPHLSCRQRTEFPTGTFGEHIHHNNSGSSGWFHTLSGGGQVLYHLLVVPVKILGSSHGFKVPGEATVKGNNFREGNV